MSSPIIKPEHHALVKGIADLLSAGLHNSTAAAGLIAGYTHKLETEAAPTTCQLLEHTLSLTPADMPGNRAVEVDDCGNVVIPEDHPARAELVELRLLVKELEVRQKALIEAGDVLAQRWAGLAGEGYNAAETAWDNAKKVSAPPAAYTPTCPPPASNYTGHTVCHKCGNTHWMYADCPIKTNNQ